MTTSEQLFSEPHNWCDRVCERCPLARVCRVATLHDSMLDGPEYRWVEETGEVVDDDEDGCWVATPIPQVAYMPAFGSSPRGQLQTDAYLLRAAGFELVLSLRPTERLCEPHVPGRAIVLAMKLVRVAAHLEDPSEELWAWDVVPNLLLIEQLVASIGEALAGRCDRSASVKAFSKIQEKITPLLARIDPAQRKRLQVLVEHRAAPSPFCTVPERRIAAE